MKNNHIEAICAHFDLGLAIKPPIKVEGGLLHRMWRLDTKKGSYAIKQLSKDIDLTNQNIIKNYELSEHIASQFISQSIPGVCAIQNSGKYLLVIENTGFLVYPWVEAKALDQHGVSENHALKIAVILAKMHSLNLDVSEISQPEYHFQTKEKILELIDKSEQFDCLFSQNLRKSQSNILAANEAYQQAMTILKTQRVVSHGDLDQKNVLWYSSDNPILIDWESACKINPTYDMVNTAFYWSGITGNFDIKLFFKMIEAYQNAGGKLNKDHIVSACYGAFSWIGWLVYNIERACVKGESEQKTIGAGQVEQTMVTLLHLQKVIPDLIKLFESKL